MLLFIGSASSCMPLEPTGKKQARFAQPASLHILSNRSTPTSKISRRRGTWTIKDPLFLAADLPPSAQATPESLPTPAARYRPVWHSPSILCPFILATFLCIRQRLISQVINLSHPRAPAIHGQHLPFAHHGTTTHQSKRHMACIRFIEKLLSP